MHARTHTPAHTQRHARTQTDTHTHTEERNVNVRMITHETQLCMLTHTEAHT